MLHFGAETLIDAAQESYSRFSENFPFFRPSAIGFFVDAPAFERAVRRGFARGMRRRVSGCMHVTLGRGLDPAGAIAARSRLFFIARRLRRAMLLANAQRRSSNANGYRPKAEFSPRG